MDIRSNHQEETEDNETQTSVGQEELSQQGRASIQGMYDASAEKAIPTEVTDDTQKQIDEGIDQLKGIEDIRPNVWIEASETERLGALQQVESSMADIQGRPALDVISNQMPQNTFGFFDGNSINISADGLRSDDVAENVDTVVHEGRHAYQLYAVEHPGFHANNYEVEAWSDNFDNYLRAEDYGQEVYATQPVESDAFAYGSAIRQGLYGSQEVWS